MFVVYDNIYRRVQVRVENARQRLGLCSNTWFKVAPLVQFLT